MAAFEEMNFLTNWTQFCHWQQIILENKLFFLTKTIMVPVLNLLKVMKFQVTMKKLPKS